MPSNEPKNDHPISIRLPRDVYERLKAKADSERRSVSNYIRVLIERDLEQSQSGATVSRDPLYSTIPPLLGGRLNEPADFPDAGTASSGQPSPGEEKSGAA